MRGRLLFAFWAELAKLDTSASTYDTVFKEPTVTTPGRKEHSAIFFPVQVEPASFESLAQAAAGNMPGSEIVLVTHFEYLERNGLVDLATGLASIHQGDRLVSIRQGGCGTPSESPVVQAIRNPPGLYVTKAIPRGFGIGFSRNLLELTFEDRKRSVQAGTGGA